MALIAPLEVLIPKLQELEKCRPEMVELMIPMVDRMNTKGHDYSAALKTSDNLDECEEIGIPAWQGVVVRMGDKWSRIKTFARKGFYKVQDEKIEDTLWDLSVYCLLCIKKYRQGKKAAQLAEAAFPEVKNAP